MALVKCCECGNQISSKAVVCPHCGARAKVASSIQNIKSAVVAVFALALLAFIFWDSKDSQGSKSALKPNSDKTPTTAAKPKRKPVDYSMPLYTTSFSIVCPIDNLFDKREGRGIEAANKAAISIINRSEKVKEAGCEEWKAGIRIYISPDKATWGWQQFSEGPTLPALRVILKNDVTNDPSGRVQYEEVRAQIVPSKNIQSLIDQEEKFHGKCRGGSGDEQETMAACARRDELDDELKKLGWCFGDGTKSMAESKWQPCVN